MPIIRSFNVADGILAGERLPEEPDQLYATPEELGAAFGVRCSEAQIRFAQQSINAYCNRPSLFPCEISEPLIRLPSDRQETRLAVTPVLKILDAAGRYAFTGRRDRQSMSTMWGLSAILALQGVTPRMVPINVDLILVEPSTGIITLPFGALLFSMNQIAIRYIAGYLQIPARVKTCLARIINNVSMKGSGDRIAYNVGRISRRYATGSFITKDEERDLEPFVVRALA
jgi:hypothetical protein